MVGVTSIDVKESLDDLAQRLRQAETSTDKERLQVLYWLKQENAPSISAVAKVVGKHRNTVQTWLSRHRDGGVEAMLEIKHSPGGVRVIPQWAEAALAAQTPRKIAFCSHTILQPSILIVPNALMDNRLQTIHLFAMILTFGSTQACP